MTILSVLRTVHVAAGIVGVSVFLVPLMAPKGRGLHRRVGWIFVGAMAIVSATALVLCAARAFDPSPGAREGAAFLAYLALLTAAGAYKGIRVLRTKDRTGPTDRRLDLAVAVVLMAAGAGVLLMGVVHGFFLFIAFGVLGILGGAADLHYWRHPPTEKMHWWFQHMASMIGTGIAAVTAALVQNAPRVCAGQPSLALWLGPSVVGVALMVAGQLYYRRRFRTVVSV
jgi:uncharacterized membrane protein